MKCTKGNDCEVRKGSNLHIANGNCSPREILYIRGQKPPK
jgi:hypothetical protein